MWSLAAGCKNSSATMQTSLLLERCAGQEAKHESSIGPCRKESKLITCRTVLAKLKPATTSWHLEYWPLHSTRKTLTCQNWVKWRATKGAWGIGAHYVWLKEKETILSWIYQAEKANSRLSRKTFSHNFSLQWRTNTVTDLLTWQHGNIHFGHLLNNIPPVSTAVGLYSYVL